ncbi:MAG TPA: CpsD/CapB family tyrosine-protein kinase [Terriglobales bacterium]|nr:CpsD/CapB family tyrosine-protein kinase [Terriglobales bacterium]
MSRIYEALRQKEHEPSNGSKPDQGGELTDAVEPASGKSELKLVDEMLRAVEREPDGERPLGESFAPFELPPSKPASKPVLAPNRFPTLQLSGKKDSPLIFHNDACSLAAEQFRFLSRVIQQKFPAGGALMMTSPAPKDGKTFTTVNLASCLADAGHTVLLLEADIRQPMVHNVLGGGTNTAAGVEEVLAGAVEPSESVNFVEDLSLHVAMVARPPADPARLISGSGPKRFLAWARKHFTWVVIDAPPVLPVSDVTQLISLADAVLLVVRARKTPRQLVTRSFELLGEHLSGVVLNEATVDSNPYYRYIAEYR